MCKHEFGLCLAGEPLEVYAVPCWDRGGEDGGTGAEFGLCIPAYAEAVAVVRAAGVETETGVVGLSQDAVGGREDEVGEEDVAAAFVDQESAHCDAVECCCSLCQFS